MVHYEYPVDFAFATLRTDFNRIGTYLLYLSLFFSLSSAYGYFANFVRAVYEKPDEAG